MGMISPMPMIHIYGFSNASDPEVDSHQRIRIALKEVLVEVDMHRVWHGALGSRCCVLHLFYQRFANHSYYRLRTLAEKAQERVMIMVAVSQFSDVSLGFCLWSLLAGTEHLNCCLVQSNMGRQWMYGLLFAYLLSFSCDDLFYRYFSSVHAPTKPAQLPRPPPKRASSKPSDGNQSKEGPTVMSPARKRLKAQRDGHNMADDHVHDRLTGGNTGKSETMPMSVDFSAFGSRPPPRPTLNSADRSHLKRKLDLDF